MSVGRLVSVLVAVVVAAVGVGFVTASASSSSPPRPSQMRTQIVAAFHHLLGPPETATELTPYVQSVDTTLANAIAAGAGQSPSDDSNLTPDGTASVSTIEVVSQGVATVDFGINDGGNDNYSQPFVGDAVLTSGRWKLSWATVCVLVEAESYVCPNPPATLPGGAVPLPHSLQGDTILTHQTPDLVRPQALAVLPDGDLLIVDSDRDQILRWQPNGRLSVYAGTGQPGSAGIGGPAVDTRLPSYFGSQLAVAKDGTVYATGGNDCGLLVITPSGILERADTQLCNASGVALSASGTLYVSANSGVYRVSPSGITEIASSANPSQKVPTGVPTAVGFSPADLALEGSGDLDIYSNGPRAIWRLTPSGKLTNLGIEYADGMASAPDGSVLVAGHGGSIDRVTATAITSVTDLLSTKIAGYGVPGMRGGFQPNGIAVAPSGAIFVDTFSGNGWTDATSVAEFPTHGRPFQIPLTTPVLDTLPGSDAPGFPSPLYPASTHARGSDLAACPSTAGLKPFDAAGIAQARQVAAQYNAYTSSFWGDLHNSDRSWWSGVVYDWTSDYDNDTHTVGQAWPASLDTFAPAVAHACGEALVRDSEVVVETPSAYSWQVTHLFFLDRDGHPLVYFQAS